MSADTHRLLRRAERDYIDRTIATVRNHIDADNCWPEWANIFATEIEALRSDNASLAAVVEELQAALEPFARGAAAFDNAEGTYGNGPVFERIGTGGHWQFTIADVRRAAAALARAAGQGRS